MAESRAPLTDHDREILRDLIQRLQEELGDCLRKVIVFGSRARGDHRPSSDWDVLVVVTGLDEGIKRRICEIRYRVTWDADFEPLISLLCLAERELMGRKSGLMSNIAREGQLLHS